MPYNNTKLVTYTTMKEPLKTVHGFVSLLSFTCAVHFIGIALGIVNFDERMRERLREMARNNVLMALNLKTRND